jgi:hypothetical protein
MLLVLLLVMASSPSVAAVTTTQVKEKKPRQLVFEPSGYEKVALLVSKGSNYRYHQFSMTMPLKLDVEGPTNLEILIRILYDITMKGIQEYTMKIEEEGLLGARSEVGVHYLKAVKSRVSTLKDENTIVPSKAQTINLAVPKGKHVYHINFKAGLAKRALIRVLIPAKDLKIRKKAKRP